MRLQSLSGTLNSVTLKTETHLLSSPPLQPQTLQLVALSIYSIFDVTSWKLSGGDVEVCDCGVVHL